MSTYARIENNIPVEYPLFEGQLQERFPQLVFPLDNNAILPDNYVRVLDNPDYMFDHTHRYEEALPVFEGGIWKQNWNAVPLTNEEVQLRVGLISNTVRKRRDSLLQQSDALVMIDRWETYTQETKQIIAQYRQDLRDVPQQPGFPTSVVFPQLTL